MWKEISKVAGCVNVYVLGASGREGVSVDNLRSYRPWYGLWILFCAQPFSHVWLFAALSTACQAPLRSKAIPFWVRWFEQGSDFMFLKDPSNSVVDNFGFLWVELRELMNLDEKQKKKKKNASLHLIICNWNLACLPIIIYAANHFSVSSFCDFDMNGNHRYFHIILLLL